ncbi:GABA-specific permease [Polychaeton citri CBS 116435]|uniref:GABA-specific permease n=1 Tax=Polychaeton citri CBS 116435 TaxID=1314669 RepID=A0A9P4QGI4_9PEZI|nr:GABA-specific permease [Polychaeton citri CBS 116435]
MDEAKAYDLHISATSAIEFRADSVVDEKHGTARDVLDMDRMGKKQLFKRNFRFFSIFSFAMVLLSTWEAVLGTAAFGLGNGGTAGLIYVYIGAYIGMLFCVVSMAEMASMAPTAGGQYHWISEFAPPSAQKFLSYSVGWLCVLGWQVGTAAGSFLAATELQGILILNYPDTYEFERWHGTLITILIVLLLAVFNTVGLRYLPWLETFALVLHLGGFLAYVIPCWVMGPRASDREVWTVFTNEGDWGSIGLACLVGIISPLTATIGADSSAHLSEELRNAAKSLPRAMILTMLFNGALGFIMVITFCYTVGDVESVLETPTGYPFIQLYYNATGSIAGTTAMVSIMIVLSIFNATANMATASRQLFAFARDNGFPFKAFFAVVPQHGIVKEVPLNAIIFTIICTCLLSLINIGSTIAYNQILSLGLAALLCSYLVSTGCMALRRLRGQQMLRAYFTLGKLGLPINLIAVGFLILAFIFSFFPPMASPEPASMNWAILVFGFVVMWSLI